MSKWKSLSLLLVLATVTLIVFAGIKEVNSRAEIPVRDVVLATRWNLRAIDSVVDHLHTGEVVLRSGLGADSRLLSQMNLRDKTYSHCGIVIVENGYPFVYHAIGGEDNPDERLHRDSAKVFFNPQYNFGLGVVTYGFTPVQLGSVVHTVRAIYLARPRFDLKFDLASDTALYCTEFIYKALNKATGDTAFITPTRFLGRTYVGTDDLFLNPHAHLVTKVRYK